jgi:acyl carrier protein
VGVSSIINYPLRCVVIIEHANNERSGELVENLKTEIIAIISEVAEVPADRISENSKMAELGVDSLDALRIISSIEKKYQIEVEEEHIGSVQTVSDIVNLVAVAT